MSTKAERQLKDLDVQRGKLDAQRAELVGRIRKQRSLKTIRCACCKKLHRIRDLEFLQTYHYIDLLGCTDSAYWTPREGSFLCPDSSVRNRLLFHSYWNISYEKRDDLKHNAEQQFMRTYGLLFKSRSEYHDDWGQFGTGDPKPELIPNFHIDDNHKKFGIELVSAVVERVFGSCAQEEDK